MYAFLVPCVTNSVHLLHDVYLNPTLCTYIPTMCIFCRCVSFLEIINFSLTSFQLSSLLTPHYGDQTSSHEYPVLLHTHTHRVKERKRMRERSWKQIEVLFLLSLLQGEDVQLCPCLYNHFVFAY